VKHTFEYILLSTCLCYLFPFICVFCFKIYCLQQSIFHCSLLVLNLMHMNQFSSLSLNVLFDIILNEFLTYTYSKSISAPSWFLSQEVSNHSFLWEPRCGFKNLESLTSQDLTIFQNIGNFGRKWIKSFWIGNMSPWFCRNIYYLLFFRKLDPWFRILNSSLRHAILC